MNEGLLSEKGVGAERLVLSGGGESEGGQGLTGSELGSAAGQG